MFAVGLPAQTVNRVGQHEDDDSSSADVSVS